MVIAAMSARERGSVITKEIQARRWGIGLDTAHRTLTATMQKGIRRVLHPVEWHYKARQCQQVSTMTPRLERKRRSMCRRRSLF
jgi:hypothetical protein